MALEKDRKKEIVADTSSLLANSKLTVFAKYPGTSVKAMQQLRQDSRENGTTVRVIKNRLFKKSVENNEAFRNIDLGVIKGQLLYAFNDKDEVAPAQSLAKFAKTETQLEFVGAITPDGGLLEAQEVKAIAGLPTKEQLRAQLVGTISAPLRGFAGVLSGNVRGILNALNARAESIN